MSTVDNALLELRGITKRFVGVTANDRVDLNIAKAEIHALLGENGAGKSTLVKMIYGLLQADEGQMLWKGEAVTVANPAASRALGIGMVFQHFSLFDALSAAQNIALTLERDASIDEVCSEAMAISERYQLPINPNAIVGDLSVGERQRIEIIRALMQSPTLLILDEPTSVLTPQEADKLFITLESLREDGTSVLYISHRLDEVRRLCDRATVLRHGKVVGHTRPQEQSAASLAEMMVGEEIGEVRKSHSTAGAHIQLKLNALSWSSDNPFGVSLSKINLEVASGAIVGIAGVAGNGQSEFFQCISGESRSSAEMVELDGEQVGHWGINQRRLAQAAFIPEERLGHGAVPAMRLSDNLLLSRHATDPIFSGPTGINESALLRQTREIVSHMDVRKTSENPAASALSGGNLQKFLVGRELDRNPRLLVINQPTWGVDAGAASLIHQSLIEMAAAGCAILLISQDLDELFEVCDSIAVMHNGQLGAPTPIAQCSAESLGLQMGGLGVNA